MKELLLISSLLLTVSCSQGLSDNLKKQAKLKIQDAKVNVIGTRNKLSLSGYEMGKELKLSDKDEKEILKAKQATALTGKSIELSMRKYAIVAHAKAPEGGLFVAGKKLFKNEKEFDSWLETKIENEAFDKRCLQRQYVPGMGEVCRKFDKKKKANGDQIISEIKSEFSTTKKMEKGERVTVDYELAVISVTTDGNKQEYVEIKRMN